MTTYCNKVTWSLYIKDIKLLMTEYIKALQLNPEFMWSYFTQKDMLYSLRKSPTLGLPKNLSFYYGANVAQVIFVVLSYKSSYCCKVQ